MLTLRPGAIHCLVDGFQQFIRRKRLPEIGEPCWSFIDETGNQNDRDAGERVLDRVRQIDSVHVPRHLNVDNHQANFSAKLLKNTERLNCILGFKTLKTYTL